MNELIHPFCALIAFAGLIYKLGHLRLRTPDPAVIALCLVFAFSGLSFAMSTPVVWLATTQLFGVPNIASLISDVCVVLLVTSELVLLLVWTRRPKDALRASARLLIVRAIVVGVLITLFFMLDPVNEQSTDFFVYYAHSPYCAAYLLIYIAVDTVSAIRISHLCWQFARSAGRYWLAAGLRLVAIGSWTTLGYCVIRTADVIGYHLGLDMHGAEPIALLCGAVGAAAKLVGWTLPGWAPMLGTARRRLRQYRAYRGLTPLWRPLATAAPQVAMVTPSGTLLSTLTLADIEFRLYRRVIEIRDSYLYLAQFCLPGVLADATARHRAAGLTGEELAAAIEADQLRAALAAHRRAEPAPDPADLGSPPAATTMADETSWLLRVSRSFA
ncbi:hypothetical protein D5S17_19420 [Pseudonocardiaceae bacterium YIM PH 21723]|nr:hypothetical protein D5S17_19420 [Pseudonocardiaceae bacterium YIM PH 21723]